MDVRRALLLFAIVLGAAAVAASLAPRSDDESAPATAEEAGAPPAGPRAGAPTQLRFVTGTGERERRRLEAREPGVVTVAVQSPGEVEIPELGLIQPAEPGTPARFDVLVPEPGRYEITFRPIGDDPDRVGVLEIARAR